ncbi:pirin family protein [Undibacterium sp. Jales W-56]|uniref:pirin family protein n=1 Tax=Undibacterium sp. Jales W-56 TaxID=2897325 RepID=UPI0021CE5C4D|nr:pirin family protein [Undibacterium sp. Jales W-56]MCU6432770.1 pirin family protein [Undibacterium sp. Jales W-56]
MLTIRKSADRGDANHGWLKSKHSFSFAEYFDEQHMGFGPLRVINEDRVEAGRGFGTHGHRDMEIISYVLDGELAHKDSMGTGSVIRYGDVQRMSAGSGVRHSEFNHSSSNPVHFLQIWIEPNVKGLAPSYEEKHFDTVSKQGALRLIASPDGHDNSVLIHQNASIFAAILNGDEQVTQPLAAGRLGYVYVAKGQLQVNGLLLETGDALKINDEVAITLSQAIQAEVLVFDLPVH